MGTVNVEHPLCKLPRKAVKACPGRDRAFSGALSGPHALFHLESGHAIPFSPQDFCSPCEFVYCCHSTQIPWAGICIKFTDTQCQNIHRPWSLEPGPWSRARTNSWMPDLRPHPKTVPTTQDRPCTLNASHWTPETDREPWTPDSIHQTLEPGLHVDPTPNPACKATPKETPHPRHTAPGHRPWRQNPDV